MDRYLAWLMTDHILNHKYANSHDYIPQIFQPPSYKLVFWGFAIVIAIVVALAIIGFPTVKLV